MTRVAEQDLYEWPFHHETAVCEDCGDEIPIPDADDPNGDMKAPHWRREKHLDPFGDVFEALCDPCYAEAVSAIIQGGGQA